MFKPALIAIALCSGIALPPQFVAAGEAEKQLTARCALSSQGMPAAFAECAIVGLYFAELKKCLIGDECMGEHNTGVQWVGWFNRTVLNSCGFRAIDAVQPRVMIFNNADVPIDIALEFPEGPGAHSRISPDHYEIWTLDWCDNWINLDSPGENNGWDAGSVIEFDYGEDGNIHQYSVTPSN
jgi:hypothetical protein